MGQAKVNAQRKVTQVEENNLIGAINQYYATYSRLPSSSMAVSAAAVETGPNANSNDFTYGTTGFTIKPAGLNVPNIGTIAGGAKNNSYQTNNAEVMSILRDDNVAPEFSNNMAHIYNPQQTVFYTPKSGGSNAVGTMAGNPGLGSDEVLRDVWGMPYIITLDLGYDDHVFDFTLNEMYQINHKGAPPLNTPGKAVVWSFGPARTVSTTVGLGVGVNKYAVLNFQ